MSDTAMRLGALLTERGWTVAVAETTTGGLICSRIVSVAGSSKYLDRGVIAYSRQSKLDLGVPEALLDGQGAVSREAAQAMAEAVRGRSGATFGIAETGIAGPVQGRSSKPLGTAYVSIAGPEGSEGHEFRFQGDRDSVREQIAEAALNALLGAVQGSPVSA